MRRLLAIAFVVLCAGSLVEPGLAAVPPSAILFPSGRSLDGNLRLYVVDSDGSGLKDIGIPGPLADQHWSPDGRWIAYSRPSGQLPTRRTTST